MTSLNQSSRLCNLEKRVTPLKNLQTRVRIGRSARKTTVKPRAAYMPSFGSSESSLHGVLHSTKLPSTLAGKILSRRFKDKPALFGFAETLLLFYNILAGHAIHPLAQKLLTYALI
jgi:hypothetical protein